MQAHGDLPIGRWGCTRARFAGAVRLDKMRVYGLERGEWRKTERRQTADG